MTVTEPSRRERKKDETRERIFRAAVELFRAKGFEATTLDEITEKADVAKGTFFNYFSGKEAVLGYLSARRLRDLEENAGEILSSARDARAKLLEVYALAASAYAEDRLLSRYVLTEVMKRLFDPLEESGRRWHQFALKILEAGRGSGELRADLPLERACALLSSVYFSTLYSWACSASADFPLQEELRARLTLAMEGLGPLRGRQ